MCEHTESSRRAAPKPSLPVSSPSLGVRLFPAMRFDVTDTTCLHLAGSGPGPGYARWEDGHCLLGARGGEGHDRRTCA